MNILQCFHAQAKPIWAVNILQYIQRNGRGDLETKARHSIALANRPRQFRTLNIYRPRLRQQIGTRHSVPIRRVVREARRARFSQSRSNRRHATPTDRCRSAVGVFLAKPSATITLSVATRSVISDPLKATFITMPNGLLSRQMRFPFHLAYASPRR